MSENRQVSYQQAVKNAHQAARRGDRAQVRYWAERAVRIAPEREEIWILLGDLSQSEKRVKFYTKAVEVNPQSQQARQRLSQALKQLRKAQGGREQSLKPEIQPAVPFKATIHRKTTMRSALAAVTAAVFLGFLSWLGLSSLPALAGTTGEILITPTPQVFLAARDNMLTPTPTQTPTPTATFTPTPTFTATPSPTWTPLPPTATPQPVYGPRPGNIGSREFWLEVDLGDQIMVAHSGDEVLRVFSISTGKSSTPTITGSYQVYNKLNSQNMAGSDYYLPDVPFVMYFYKDFAIHGAYWHTDFGIPVSHGCINMIPGDAGWVYEAVRIGTWVIIHY
jgi:lipoprotein-anchoring transpeptidase ErfK/SrfK